MLHAVFLYKESFVQSESSIICSALRFLYLFFVTNEHCGSFRNLSLSLFKSQKYLVNTRDTISAERDPNALCVKRIKPFERFYHHHH